MTSAEIISEIKNLPPTGQAEVIQFAYRLNAARKLSPEELGALAEKMVEAEDEAEALVLRDAILRGF